MATSSFARQSTSTPYTTPLRTRDDRPAKRKKEAAQRTDIWTNLLRQTREAQARSRTQALQHRSLIVCGGSPDDQRQFIHSLARPPPPAPPSRKQSPQKTRGEVRLSNRYAYGYGHVTLYSPPAVQGAGLLGAEAEEAARVEVHTLPEAEEGYEGVLRRLLNGEKDGKRENDVDDDDATGPTQHEEARRPAITLLLSWKEPWRFLALLRRWLHLLAHALLPPDSRPEDPLDILKAHSLALTVVVQHVEAQEGLEREGYKEDAFDYISQCLRTCLLPLSAALVYTSTSPPPQQPGSPLSEVQKVLFTSLQLDLATLSPAPAKGSLPTKIEDLAARHNVVDRMALVVPSGWDSLGKIRLLSETFSPETTLEAWINDLAIPPPPTEPAENPPPTKSNTSTNEHPPTEVYASSPVASEDADLASRPLSPSKSSYSAINAYEQRTPDPQAHKIPKPPRIEVTTKPDQLFLAEVRTHLQEMEAQDAERAAAKSNSAATAAVGGGRSAIGVPSGDQTGALNELGDVSFNVGGVSYNTVSAEAAIESLKHPRAREVSASSPRTSTPRPPRREDREGNTASSREVSASTPTAPGTSKSGELPVEKLEEYFHSLMKKGGGGGGSGSSTPSKAPTSKKER